MRYTMASHWTKDKRPSRKRYWENRTLEKRKVRHILANKQRLPDKKDGSKGQVMTEPEARLWWQTRRKHRLMDKYLPLNIQYGNR